jgi:hypothetical protein
MTSTTLEHERKRTANPPRTPGPLGAYPIETGPGNRIAKAIDPVTEEAYWRENFSSRPYVNRGEVFNEYRPAYRYGVDAYARREGRSFEQAEPELMRDWDHAKGISSLTWDDAMHATRDAWQHVSDIVERATPGDSDHDGK